jgi:trans-aconitate methyltransferase
VGIVQDGVFAGRDEKNRSIQRFLSKKSVVMDVGCGDCFFAKTLLQHYPKIKELWGIDINLDEDSTEGKLRVVNGLNKVEPEHVDVILMMDVLEHIKHDVDYLKSLRHYLADGKARLFITVPAFQRLYSQHDKDLRHYRRYNYKRLNHALEEAGYEIESSHYFYVSLVIGRLLTKNKSKNINDWKYPEKHVLTMMVKLILNLDYRVCSLLSKVGIRLGGLSLVAIAKPKYTGVGGTL